MTITLDLNQQKYDVFNIEDSSNTKVELQNKNFIFGKNGAGKSTICKMINSQFSEEYDVFVFSGFNNVLGDRKLNAVVLGEENINAKNEIDSIEAEIDTVNTQIEVLEKKLKSLKWHDEYLEQGLEKNPLFLRLEEIDEKRRKQSKELEVFYRVKAKELKEFKDPQITKPSYDKNAFMKDITLAKILEKVEKEKFENTLVDRSKSLIPPNYKLVNIDFLNLIIEINKILEYKIESVTFIDELKESPDKKEFAERGLDLHKSGENCSFCGNEITETRIKELRAFISVSDVKQHEEKINNKLLEIEKLIKNIQAIKEINKEYYYSNFHQDIIEINSEIKMKKNEYEYLLKELESVLNKKSRSMFHSFEPINLQIPTPLSFIEDEVNLLIERNNEWTRNLENNKNSAQEKLRLHHVAKKITEKDEYKFGWKGLEVEEYELTELNNTYKQASKDLAYEILNIEGNKHM